VIVDVCGSQLNVKLVSKKFVTLFSFRRQRQITITRVVVLKQLVISILLSTHAHARAKACTWTTTWLVGVLVSAEVQVALGVAQEVACGHVKSAMSVTGCSRVTALTANAAKLRGPPRAR